MADQHQAPMEDKSDISLATKELHRTWPYVMVKVGNVEIGQHFFMQKASSHPLIFEELYIMAAHTKAKVLDK